MIWNGIMTLIASCLIPTILLQNYLMPWMMQIGIYFIIMIFHYLILSSKKFEVTSLTLPMLGLWVHWEWSCQNKFSSQARSCEAFWPLPFKWFERSHYRCQLWEVWETQATTWYPLNSQRFYKVFIQGLLFLPLFSHICFLPKLYSLFSIT